jgi:nickel superoxide dismutase
MAAKIATIALSGLLLAGGAATSRAHCEIPCGIYGDRMRVEMLEEHFDTVEKSMHSINDLTAARDRNYNQLVRWIDNKELHANKVQEIVYQYFMNQRVKPADKSDQDAYKVYVEQITLLHQMLVYAMKCKQTTDPQNVRKLRSLLKDFEKAYFKEHGHAH